MTQPKESIKCLESRNIFSLDCSSGSNTPGNYCKLAGRANSPTVLSTHGYFNGQFIVYGLPCSYIWFSAHNWSVDNKC